MFWSHYINGSINQANLDGSNPTIIIANVNRPSKPPFCSVIAKDTISSEWYIFPLKLQVA